MLLVIRHLVTSSDALVTSSFLFLVVRPGTPSSVLAPSLVEIACPRPGAQETLSYPEITKDPHEERASSVILSSASRTVQDRNKRKEHEKARPLIQGALTFLFSLLCSY